MMLWKCCTQYASKFGKLSSGYRTGKGQFSFQSQRKAMPKNAQPTTQLCSSHVSKVMLKSLQARFQENFVGFYQTSTWIRRRYTYVPSHLNLPSSFFNFVSVWDDGCLPNLLWLSFHDVSFHTSFHIYKSNHYAVFLKLV